jgi:hypothetical protein
MANRIKDPSGEPALQVTEPARAASLVEEDSEGQVRDRSKVVVVSFDGLLLVFDREEVPVSERWEIIELAGRETASLYRATHARMRQSGNGYSVQLRSAVDAGLRVGDKAPVYPARNARMLAITDASGDQRRLAKDLVSSREAQAQD